MLSGITKIIGGVIMRYTDLLEVYDYFQPVYDITEERGNYWKQFIPTEDFEDVLKLFLNSLESKDPKDKRSIWMMGTYGTGKSHATGVIKHLLWDPLDEVEDFIERIRDARLKERLRRFREENRVFPVTLKGMSGIYDSKSMTLTIEKAVKDVLRREGIEVLVKSEFEKYIDYIEETTNKDTINWSNIIRNSIGLSALVNSVDGLIGELKDNNISVLKELEASINFRIPFESIEDWLIEVVEKLKISNICTSMAIYWDEFTSLLELDRSPEILSVLQNIAEKCFHNDLYLFIISHRHPQQTQIKEDFKKVLDRFHEKEYTMENITTFHIISNAIRKKDDEKWKELRESVFRGNNKLSELILRLTNEDLNTRIALRDVFPIHPYTAFLATGISRFIGSTERSIFNFLYDEDKGFVKFIREPLEEGEYFLTPDYLWDFFLHDFERTSSEKIFSVIEKYKHFAESLEKQGRPYLAIFKGILLLNILRAYTEIPIKTQSNVVSANPFSPSEENIRAMFTGSLYERCVDEVLSFIDENNYISKTPDGFIVSSISLPHRELEKEKKDVREKYRNITKALSEEQKSELLNYFRENILREAEIELCWAGLKEYELKMSLRDSFRLPSTLHMAIFIAKDDNEVNNAINIVRDINNSDDLIKKDIIFVISNEPLGEEQYRRIIDYTAIRNVSSRHLFREEEILYQRYVDEILNQWLNKVKNGRLEILHRDRIYNCCRDDLSSCINERISPEIFSSGAERIDGLRDDINIWFKRVSEKAIEIFIFSSSRDDFEERTKNSPFKNLRDILRSKNGEYIVDRELRFRGDVDLDHPTVKIYKEIERTIQGYGGKSFNLGKSLDFLQNPPFGLYSNMVNSGILAFALRHFIDKLYEEGTGRRIDKELMRDKVKAIFEYWGKKKDSETLNVRLGTPEERELIVTLQELFNLERENDLNSIKRYILGWIDETGYPIWSIKTLGSNPEGIDKAAKAIVILAISLNKEVSLENIREILKILQMSKADLKLLLNKDKLREGFIKWLKEKENLELKDEELDNLLTYLRKNIKDDKNIEKKIALWEENDVIVKIRDWENISEVEKKERELISLIGDIFQIENISNLDELRSRLREHINRDIGYPLWVFKYTFNNKEIENSLDCIDSFIKNNGGLDKSTVDRYIEELNRRRNIFKLNLNSNIAEESMRLWLKERTSIEASRIIPYLRKNLKKDIYLWEEKDLETTLREYELGDIVKDIFNLEEVENIDDLKNKIKKWVLDSGYPFWIFTFNITDDQVIQSSEIIETILSSTSTLNIDKLNRFKEILSREKNELRDIFTEEKARDNFNEWLRGVVRLKMLEDRDLENMLRKIRGTVSNDDFYWNKDRLENWVMKNIKNLIPENIKGRIRERVESSRRDFKDLLLKLLDTHPEIYDWIGEFWEEL